jgi:uncharacterized membrane protein YeaQ/YmgE (transglycosylase-associated protein family)
MISPTLILGFALSTLYSLVFFLVFGHGWLRFFFYWIVGIVGFILGQWIANLIGLSIFSIGELNLIEASVMSWVSLFAVRAWGK